MLPGDLGVPVAAPFSAAACLHVPACHINAECRAHPCIMLLPPALAICRHLAVLLPWPPIDPTSSASASAVREVQDSTGTSAATADPSARLPLVGIAPDHTCNVLTSRNCPPYTHRQRHTPEPIQLPMAVAACCASASSALGWSRWRHSRAAAAPAGPAWPSGSSGKQPRHKATVAL